MIFENVLKTHMSHPAVPNFMRFVTHFPVFMGYRMEIHGYCSEFCEFSQKSRGLSTHMAPFFLTARYYDILMFVWGRGTLAKAKGGAKRRF